MWAAGDSGSPYFDRSVARFGRTRLVLAPAPKLPSAPPAGSPDAAVQVLVETIGDWQECTERGRPPALLGGITLAEGLDGLSLCWDYARLPEEVAPPPLHPRTASQAPARRASSIGPATLGGGRMRCGGDAGDVGVRQVLIGPRGVLRDAGAACGRCGCDKGWPRTFW